jgi:hypothetical protein
MVILISNLAWGIQAHAGLVVVCGTDSPIKQLSPEQAKRLYLGQVTALSDGTPASVVDLPVGPTRDSFYLALTGKNPSQIRAYWSRLVFSGRALPPREAGSIAELRTMLRENRNLVGYLKDSEVDAGLKVLLIVE